MEQTGNTLVFTFQGEPTPGLEALACGLKETFVSHGYRFEPAAKLPRLVLNFITLDAPRPYRLEVSRMPAEPIRVFYPYLVRALSNVLLVYVPNQGAFFFTLELGHYMEPEGEGFYERLYRRLDPIARSTLVINNRFEPDLEPELWEGDELTRAMSIAGRRLAEWDLLPAPFPLEKILPPEDLRHVQRLYHIGGLSYGNISARKDATRFWMSASGVDKSRLHQIGRDILMVKGYDAQAQAIVLSVPPHVQPRRVSVDAIEHWMIYREHPQIGAIIHVHAWMEGVPSTSFNYPCGTYELAKAVAEKIREAHDPSRAVVGLKNHGLTITGRSLEDILERIDGKLLPQVPML